MTDEKQQAAYKGRTKKAPQQVITQNMPTPVRQALHQVAKTRNGKIFLKWVMAYCGFKYSSLTMTEEGRLLIDAIVHNEAKRAVWLDIRKNIAPELLNLIEGEEIHENKNVGKTLD